MNFLIDLFYRLPFSVLKSLPLNFLSKISGKLADSDLSRHLIPVFANLYRINLHEAEHPTGHFRNFNSFFIRTLRKGSREIDLSSDKIISPADGKLSYSKITRGEIWFIKDKSYSLAKLIEDEEVSRFDGGHALTVYLSPRDYHRFHMPIDGRILCPPKKINGYLFSVIPSVMNRINDLFCVNERLIYSFENETFGRFYVVAVGATFVGSIIDLADIKNKKAGETVLKGAELGAFKFGGSTIVLITEKAFPMSQDNKSFCSNRGEVKFGEIL